ncbi:carboxymuconolactone decarboxylase family protein [Polynucleobacter sp. UK-FUSCHL-C3]|uniref:Carboxymuconolactone decarboxylase family protein n=1 Tax=Polynucleobacter sp. UK-FUSCHL-C3 TaxID=2955208 RepID=A0AAU8A1H0_9BURK
MSRVRTITKNEVPLDLQEIYSKFSDGYSSFRNQIGVLAHVPSALNHIPSMLLELRETQNIPFRYVELAIVTVSKLNECQYCIGHHKPLLSVEGLSSSGIDSILDYKNHPELTDVDKLVIEYSIGVTNAPQKIKDTLFNELKIHFTESQIVELTLRICLCGFFNRFNDSLQIESEL